MNIIKYNITLFIVMFLVALCFNGMNALSYSLSHLYLSYTLIYSSLFMASNMIWAHELVHYLVHSYMNYNVFFCGVLLSLFFFYILRLQPFVNEEQWMKRMIPHHSTAITTTSKILNKNPNEHTKQLAESILRVQEEEINYMKYIIDP